IIRKELIRTLELNPRFIEGYHLLGFVNLVENVDIDDSIKLLQNALSISPGNENVNFILGQLYLRKKDFDTARKIIEPLATTANTAQMRTSAENMLNQINNAAESWARYQENLNRRNASTDTTTSDTKSAGDTLEKNSTEPTRPKLRRKDEGEPSQPDLCTSFPGEKVKGLLTKWECSRTGITFFV